MFLPKEVLSILAAGSCKIETKTRVSLKYCVSDCLWNMFFDSNLPQTPTTLILLGILLILRPFTLL